MLVWVVEGLTAAALAIKGCDVHKCKHMRRMRMKSEILHPDKVECAFCGCDIMRYAADTTQHYIVPVL